jgi:hypothetical protein
MGKRLGILGAVTALLALTIGVVSPAMGSSSDREHHRDQRHRTIRVLATITEASFLDLGAQGDSLGDQIVFSNKLTQDGKQVGHEGAVCIKISVERNEAQCNATFVFPDGQITGQALVTYGSLAPYFAAITGGTGKYDDAKGEVQIRPVSATSGIHIFHLEH